MIILKDNARQIVTKPAAGLRPLPLRRVLGTPAGNLLNAQLELKVRAQKREAERASNLISQLLEGRR